MLIKTIFTYNMRAKRRVFWGGGRGGEKDIYTDFVGVHSGNFSKDTEAIQSKKKAKSSDQEDLQHWH